ncbi:MAG: SDR family oxidoreductase [Planctomycetes bacterium]|nr:SDR family oxidoreductase [Planctomycetota bacterium]
MKISGRTAIITGSTGKLGQSIALCLAKEGCKCVCHYFTGQERAEELVGKTKELGGEAISAQADLSDERQIDTLFEKALQIGSPTILINSAGVFERQPLENITSESMQKILQINVVGPVLACKRFWQIINTKYPDTTDVVAKIINISDIGGVRPWAEYTAYCSSKAALNAATKSLAKELAPAISVNSVTPGIVSWPADFDQTQRQKQLKMIPAGRIATAEEITGAIIFLLENDYITGQVLNIDGGRCI